MGILKKQAKDTAIKRLVEKYNYEEYEATKIITGIETQIEGEFTRRLRVIAEAHKAETGGKK